MQKTDLIEMMTALLVDALKEEGSDDPGRAGAGAPLLGSDAVLSSIGLVTFITGVESVLEEEYEVEVTLVSEEAFSRRQSPFRTIDTLADYILELSGDATNDAVQEASASRPTSR